MKKSKRVTKATSKKQQQAMDKSNFIKDITITFPNFTQTYQSIDISPCITSSLHLSTKKLLKLFESQYGISSQNHQLRYYLNEGDIWMLCPKMNYLVPEDDYQQREIKIELTPCQSLISAVIGAQDESEDSAHESHEEDEADLRCRRLKQRKIKHVIEKVLRWRELYAGVGEDGKKANLQDGAKIVKISKKTLDDYLSQIKKGKRYGFNFNEHKNEKIGVLREFIRKIERGRK